MTIDNLTIDNGKLKRYQEEVSKLKLAIRDSSVKSESAVSKLKDFFEAYFKECYQKNMLDSQNAYFAKQATQQFLTIVKDNLKLSDDELEKCVSKALNGIDLSKYSISQTAIDKIKKDVGAYFKSIADILDFNFGKKPLTKDEEEKAVKKLHDDAEDFVNKNMEMPSLDLDFISNFLKTNVFSNFDRIIKRESLEFDRTALTLVNSKKIGFKAAFTKLYVPPIITLYKQFRKYEKFSVNRIGRKVKKNFKRLGKGLYNAIDFFLPLTFLKGLFKISRFIVGTGLKLVSGAFSLGMTIVSKSLNFAFSGIKLVTGTILKIGGGSFKLLTKTLSKIGVFKAFKFTTKIIVAFFKSYPGAFILGYVVGALYKQFNAIKTFVQKTFDDAKTYFDDHINKPFIQPVADWFEGSFAGFFVDEVIRIVFGNDSENKISDLLDLLAIKNKETGKPLISINKISLTILGNELEAFVTWISNAIGENFTFNNVVEHVLAPAAGSMLGAWGGAKLGALLGTAIAPGVGTVIGAAAGYIAGAIGGEWAGKKLANLMIDHGGWKGHVKRTDTRLERMSRSLLGGEPNVAKDVFYNVRTSDYITGLSNLASKAIKLNFELPEGVKTGQDGDPLKEYIHSGLLDYREIAELRKKGPDAIAEFKENLMSLNGLKNLTYDMIYQEVSSAYLRMRNLLEAPKFMSLRMLFPEDYKTNLTIDGSTLKFDKEYNGRSLNPLIFKMFRGKFLQDLVQDLAIQRITLSDFFNTYKKFSNPLSFIKYLEETDKDFGSLLDGFENGTKLEYLIFPNYEASYDILNAYIGSPWHQSPTSAQGIAQMLPKDILRRVNISARNETDVNTIGVYDPFAPEGRAYDNNPNLQTAIQVFASDYFKTHMNEILYIIPADKTQSRFNRFFSGQHSEEQSASNFLQSFFSLKRIDEEFKTRLKPGAAPEDKSYEFYKYRELYKTVLSSMGELSEEERESLNENRVLSRIAFWIEKGMANRHVDKEDYIRMAIHEEIADPAHISINANTGFEQMNARVADFIGQRLEGVLATLSDSTLDSASTESTVSTSLAETSQLFNQYSDFIIDNNEFLSDTIYPFIRDLAEKGIPKETIKERFGEEMFFGAFSEESSPNPTDFVAGDSVSPSVE